jgi:hypothetical protein
VICCVEKWVFAMSKYLDINHAHVLDARVKYPDCSFVALYNETVMPPVLPKVHQDNDRAG